MKAFYQFLAPHSLLLILCLVLLWLVRLFKYVMLLSDY